MGSQGCEFCSLSAFLCFEFNWVVGFIYFLISKPINYSPEIKVSPILK